MHSRYINTSNGVSHFIKKYSYLIQRLKQAKYQYKMPHPFLDTGLGAFAGYELGRMTGVGNPMIDAGLGGFAGYELGNNFGGFGGGNGGFGGGYGGYGGYGGGFNGGFGGGYW